MVRNGCYIVQRSVIEADVFPEIQSLRRSNLTNYTGFQQYTSLSILNIECVLNARGHVLMFYRIGDVEHERHCREVYEHDSRFYDRSVLDCLAAFKEIAGYSISEFEDTFYAVIGSERSLVEWNVVHVPADSADGQYVSVFIEALFAYSICKTAERLLGSLLSSSTRHATERLIGHAQDLAFLERPQHFLVAKNEIALMNSFYEMWGIDEDVLRLQARFSQVIDTYNLRFNQIQAQRGMSLNRIAAGVAVVALISVADSLAKIVPGISVDLLQRAFAVTGVGLLLWGLTPDLTRLLLLARAAVRSHYLKGRLRIFRRVRGDDN